MTLIKSLLLGSAAGIVAIASAQAADLPTKKGAPAAEYVKVCKMTLGGAPALGFTLPGSDTCLKLSGYVSAQASYLSGFANGQDAIGLFVRGNVAWDAVSNTAAGPLYAHIDLNSQHGAGADYENASGYSSYSGGYVALDNAYLQWAGITAGQHGSFFDFFAGGPTWDDFISSDHTGTGTLLFAYTASLGGGFSATLSAEEVEVATGFQPGAGYNGVRSPDWVANVTWAQAWGKLQLAALAHDVDTLTGVNTWGWAFSGGLQVNLPGLPGSDVRLQAIYTDGATGYLGLYNSFGIYGNAPFSNTVNGGATPAWAGFGYDANNFGALVTGYSFAGAVDFAVNPQFTITPELSYGNLSYSAGNSATEWVGGGTIAWKPVTNLVFNLDLLYASGTNTVSYVGYSYSGFNGKLRIERDF